mgnify:FL=1
MRFSKETEPWVIWRMPPALKTEMGMESVVNWAVERNVNVVIGQFESHEDISGFRENGMVVYAQDFKEKLEGCSKITADYIGTGRMAADYYASHGFKNFAFFGYRDVCWSYERYVGFRDRVAELGFGESFYLYDSIDLDDLWNVESVKVAQWLRNLPKPIAVFACDDNQASLLIEVANANDVRIPADVSVLGVDNDEIVCNLTSPSLSSIKINIEEGGYLTAMQAIKALNDDDPSVSDVVLHPLGVETRESTSEFATTDPMVIKVLEFVRNNLHRHINVADVLKVVPASRRLLELRFKEVTGYTLYNYISNSRIKYFAERLLNTKDSVSEIAFSMDEFDVKSISRRFKAIMGCTPSQYRDSKLTER